MPAVVRVKRRIDEEPLNAFVLNGKRRRLNTENLAAAGGALSDERYRAEDKNEITTLLKFAGTIKEQDDTATKKFVRLTKEEALSRLTKEEAEELVKFRNTQRKATAVVEQSRREARRCMRENRFRIVNCMRKSLNENEDDTVDDEQAAASNAQKLTILDIEKQNDKEDEDDVDDITASSSSASVAANTFSQFRPNAAAMRLSEFSEQPSDSDTGYVYDLYLPDNEEEDYADVMDDNHLSIEAFKGEFYEDIYPSDDQYNSELDEDSNDENYYKNDYPDDEEDIDKEYSDYETNTSSGNVENQLCKAITKFVIKDNDDDDDHDDADDEADAYGYNDSDGESDYYNPNPYSYKSDDDSNASGMLASSDEEASGYVHSVKVKSNAHFVNDIDVIAINDDFDKEDSSDYEKHNYSNMK